MMTAMIMKPRHIRFSAAAVAAVALSANGILAQTRSADAGGGASLTSPKYGSWGFDATGMDLSVKPGDDFFRYANGKWADRTEIPSDRTRYGNFDQLAELSENRLHAILEDAAAGKINDPDASKVAAAYASFMDEALAEQLDAKPIERELSEIRGVTTKDGMIELMGKANASGFVSIFPLFVTADAKVPARYTVMAVTGGLGLPDRDYYPAALLRHAESEISGIRRDVARDDRMGEASGERAGRCGVRDRGSRRTPGRARAARSRQDLQPDDGGGAQHGARPGFDWNRYLTQNELPKVERLVVTTNTAFPKFAKTLF
jgi:putative endopeptidase